MNPLQVVKTTWKEGDQREVKVSRIELQQGVEYDSYRRVYIADGHEWIIVAQVVKSDDKYYILECTG